MRNSGDTAGDRQRVVGYGAIAFEATAAPTDSATETEANPATDPDRSDAALGQALLTGARASIAEALGLSAPARTDHPRLRQMGASFVTLHDARGDLRGCIGQLEAWRPLGEDVHHNALAAAFSDRRFSPVTAAEYPQLHIEVSVLAPMQPLPASATAAEAAGRLQPGIDGVLLDWHGQRGTFLPQVWAQLPDAVEFLRALRQKAGLPPDFWATDIQLWRYQVIAFEEPRHARPH
ncbi:MAG: AmmeMemoRadiSam system protein A [Aquabacterium sp.]|nr:AmmeMemoRadiSam system protein A [Aquabacterium sp.]